MSTVCSCTTHATTTLADLLSERDALATRLHDREAALDDIHEELEHALRNPQIALLAICRLALRLRDSVRVRNRGRVRA